MPKPLLDGSDADDGGSGGDGDGSIYGVGVADTFPPQLAFLDDPDAFLRRFVLSLALAPPVSLRGPRAPLRPRR